MYDTKGVVKEKLAFLMDKDECHAPAILAQGRSMTREFQIMFSTPTHPKWCGCGGNVSGIRCEDWMKGCGLDSKPLNWLLDLDEPAAPQNVRELRGGMVGI